MIKSHIFIFHQVAGGDGAGPADACEAVHVAGFSFRAALVNLVHNLIEHREKIKHGRVVSVEDEMIHLISGGVGQSGHRGHREHRLDPPGLELPHLFGALEVPHVQASFALGSG